MPTIVESEEAVWNAGDFEFSDGDIVFLRRERRWVAVRHYADFDPSGGDLYGWLAEPCCPPIPFCDRSWRAKRHISARGAVVSPADADIFRRVCSHQKLSDRPPWVQDFGPGWLSNPARFPNLMGLAVTT